MGAVDSQPPGEGRPRVSVAIPVYNGETWLPRTLDSALRQTFPHFELVCVDDGSADASLDVLGRYAARDPRVRVLRTGANQGMAPRVIARFALPAARGERFVYASQDDLFSEDWLESMVRRADETGADAVVPDLVFFHEGQEDARPPLVGVRGDRSAIIPGREAARLSLDWTIPGNALWRTDLVRRVGYFDFGTYADEYTARALFLACERVAFCAGRFLYRQDNPDAITRKPSVRRFDEPYNFFRLFELLREHAFDPATIDAELLKSLRTLLRMKRQLYLDGAPPAPPGTPTADDRLRACFHAITSSPAAMASLRRSATLGERLRLAGGYGWLSALARLSAWLRRTKQRLRGRKGRSRGSEP